MLSNEEEINESIYQTFPVIVNVINANVIQTFNKIWPEMGPSIDVNKPPRPRKQNQTKSNNNKNNKEHSNIKQNKAFKHTVEAVFFLSPLGYNDIMF